MNIRKWDTACYHIRLDVFLHDACNMHWQLVSSIALYGLLRARDSWLTEGIKRSYSNTVIRRVQSCVFSLSLEMG